jgi:hypothetical protein
VVETGEVEEEGVRQQTYGALALCPLEEELGFVFKGGCAKDALAAVADGAVDHAVVAADAGGELLQEAVHGVDAVAELGKGSVASLGAGIGVCLCGSSPTCRRISGGDVERLRQVVPGSEVEGAGFDTDETEGEGQVVAVRQGLLADLAGSAEGEALVGPGLAAGGACQELVKELQRVVKALLAYGARMPKELMLFVKNMVFLDGAIARLAPDLDLFAEITHVATYFAVTHGERLAGEVGMDPTSYQFDVDGVRAAFGVDDTVETMTYRDLQERRETIRRRLRERVKAS